MTEVLTRQNDEMLWVPYGISLYLSLSCQLSVLYVIIHHFRDCNTLCFHNPGKYIRNLFKTLGVPFLFLCVCFFVFFCSSYQVSDIKKCKKLQNCQQFSIIIKALRNFLKGCIAKKGLFLSFLRLQYAINFACFKYYLLTQKWIL